MSTKLTLTIERTLIDKAKKYAKSQGRSLSDIVENYFRAIVKEEEIVSVKSSPISDSKRGFVKPFVEFDYRQEITKALNKKYLSN